MYPQPVVYDVDLKMITDAAHYAYHVFFSAEENGMKNRFLGGFFKHYIGKLGELAFYRFCMQNEIPVKHTPFREDYSKLNEKDDFIIVVAGIDRRIEVKTRMIQNAAKPDKKLRLFYNAAQFEQQKNRDFYVIFAAVDPQVRITSLIGWLPAAEIPRFPVWKGELKSPAYAIRWQDLRDLGLFVDAQRIFYDRVSVEV